MLFWVAIYIILSFGDWIPSDSSWLFVAICNTSEDIRSMISSCTVRSFRAKQPSIIAASIIPLQDTQPWFWQKYTNLGWIWSYITRANGLFFMGNWGEITTMCVELEPYTYTVTGRDEEILILIPLKFDIAPENYGMVGRRMDGPFGMASSKGPQILKKHLYEPRKKSLLLFMKSWLVNRDPYNGLLKIPI